MNFSHQNRVVGANNSGAEQSRLIEKNYKCVLVDVEKSKKKVHPQIAKHLSSLCSEAPVTVPLDLSARTTGIQKP